MATRLTFKQFLIEEWTAQEKGMLRSLGGRVLDNAETKNYELFMIELNMPGIPNKMKKQIAINKKGKSIWSMKDQFTKNQDWDIASGDDEFDEIKNIVDKWLEKHKSFSVASQNAKKQKVWASILHHLGYKLTKHHSNFPGLEEYWEISK